MSLAFEWCGLFLTLIVFQVNRRGKRRTGIVITIVTSSLFLEKEPEMSSSVSRPAAADSQKALQHFQSLLEFETDCWDVNHAISNDRKDFILLDVRGEALYKRGHIETAINLPHAKINADALIAYPLDTLFVVYCAGPHCNGTEKAAIRLAKLGRPVKKMIGGITGWLDERFPLTK
jgi:rhodanese-related sulfurtransferase